MPLEVTALLCAACFAVGAFARRAFAHHSLVRAHSPLADLMEPAALGDAIDLAARRIARRAASQAVLRGRIDHPAALPSIAEDFDPAQLNSQIAAVLRAGLRRGDRVAHSDGGEFTIIIPGADESAATRIAERLRAALARPRAPHISGANGLTASFGVAAGRNGENGDRLMRQAHRALDGALSQGQRRVVAASEFQEVLYLPAPKAQPSVAAA